MLTCMLLLIYCYTTTITRLYIVLLTSKDQNDGPNMADIIYVAITLNWASVTSNLQYTTTRLTG